MTECVEYIGYIAGFCTTTASFPQLIKIIKTKNVRDISTLNYILSTIGVVLWIIYGLLRQAFPLVIANSVSFIFVSSILTLRLIWRKN